MTKEGVLQCYRDVTNPIDQYFIFSFLKTEEWNLEVNQPAKTVAHQHNQLLLLWHTALLHIVLSLTLL